MTKLLLLAIPLTTGLLLGAEQESTSAPIPAQIKTAKTIFISNANDDCYYAGTGCVRDVFYDEFYAAMKNWGRYQIVASPADADLVFELGSGVVFIPSPRDAGAAVHAYYRLGILDPKTRVALWAFNEHADDAIFEENRIKNSARARAKIISDLKALVKTN